MTDFGVCLQDLSVSPCNYLSDFLSGCFECENAAYVCGDIKAIDILELDFQFQCKRLSEMREKGRCYTSQASKSWIHKHTKSLQILRELINLMKTEKVGNLVRFSSNDSNFYVSDIIERNITTIPLSLQSPEDTIDFLTSKEVSNGNIPEEMFPLLEVYGISTNN